MSHELTDTERRIIYLGQEMRALGAVEPNETVARYLGQVGEKLSRISDGVSLNDFSEFELELVNAVASESFSGVEV